MAAASGRRPCPSWSRSTRAARRFPPISGWRCSAAQTATSTSSPTQRCSSTSRIPHLHDLLREKAVAGCKVRVAIGDPEGACIKTRGADEHFGHGISSRCELALIHYRSLIGLDGISVHLHDTTLYNSIFRFDDEMLVNTHL